MSARVPSLPSAGSVGVSVRVVSAANPADGVIVARFNVAMLQDDALSAPESWRCLANSGSGVPLTLTTVVLNRAYPEMVLLRYAGGEAAEYTLSVTGVRSSTGEPLNDAGASVPLTVVRPGEIQSGVRLFDSVWGPLGIAQRPAARRTVDQLVANRAVATAVNVQLRQRVGASDGSSGRDGRPGLGRI